MIKSEKNVQTIRLMPEEVSIIKTAFLQNFLSGDQLWLFGSRVYLEKRGGDIDLYVETQMNDYTQATAAKRKFWRIMQDLLGEQKIDIVLNYSGSKILPIYAVAREEGRRLV